MLSINGKKFMNISEAVQWLLDNNALPFQSTANYVADTVIAKTTIINPSPAEIRIGSLVLFADGKVGTVSGITASGFMVGAESTDLSDGVPHITNIDLDAYDHLIFTMSEGSPIDAGLVKMVSSLTINASQHLIVNYNDGTSTDLGAIFQGDVNISGTLTATHARILEQIEDGSGHIRFVEGDGVPMVSAGFTASYCKWSLSGSHLMLVLSGSFTAGSEVPAATNFALYTLPEWIFDKIYPVFALQRIEVKEVVLYNDDWSEESNSPVLVLTKGSGGVIGFANVAPAFNVTKDRAFRVQFDLLIDNN